MYLLDNTQINHISGGATTAVFIAPSFLTLAICYYLLVHNDAIESSGPKFEDFNKRLSTLESLVSAQAEQLALLTGSNHTQA